MVDPTVRKELWNRDMLGRQIFKPTEEDGNCRDDRDSSALNGILLGDKWKIKPARRKEGPKPRLDAVPYTAYGRTPTTLYGVTPVPYTNTCGTYAVRLLEPMKGESSYAYPGGRYAEQELYQESDIRIPNGTTSPSPNIRMKVTKILWYSESVLFQVRNKWTRRENRLPGNCPTWIGRGPYGHMPQNVPSSSLKQVYRPSSTDPEKQATASCFELLSAAQRNPVEDDPAIVYALMRGNESPGWAQPSSYGGLRARLQTHTPGIVNQLSYGGIRHHVTNADLADFGGPSEVH
ncbi:hypothetical protein B0H11DRAFT_1936704 [Mycena galericulata]|nr:hypothetical protein B0H11DRAFT_1936704 [Mycena galericulata]